MIPITEVMKLLPQGYPFLLVDRVLEHRAGEYARGVKNVTINEPFFPGHFPNNPIMPGVLVLEAMAQLGGLLFDPRGRLVLLQAFDKVRFKSFATPGDVLTLQATMVRELGNFGRVTAEARVDDRMVCSAEVTYVFMPPEASAGE